MIQDLIVEEVRAIREQLAAQFNFDIRKIIEDAQGRQATSKSRIISLQPRQPAGPATTGADNITSQQSGETAERESSAT